MPQDFDREVLSRLPLAQAILALWQFVCDDQGLNDLYDRHRGRTYCKKITFPLMAQLVRGALLEPDGSGHKTFCHAQRDGTLNAALSSTYDKLSHLPLAVSEAFLAEGADRLRQVFPDTELAALDDAIPPSLRAFEVLVLDGKVVKRVPRRLKPARQRPGGLLGGKGLAALHLRSGLALALATDPDGEANDAKLVPALLPVVRARVAGPRLWLADRQFCDLIQTAAFTAEGGDHFLVRYHSKVHFFPDPARPAQKGQDGQGRAYEQAWGWLGGERDKRRRYVRRVTLRRDGEEDVILVTDLLGAAAYPAEDLLALYLARWGIERVFQQITEVFHLNRLIATTPQGTLFQLSFCLLLYDMIQVVRGYVAAGQGHPVEVISTELLFADVTKQLVALNELVAAERVAELLPAVPSAAAVRQRLHQLLGAVWSDGWIKAPPQRRKPPAQKKGQRDHTSVYRLLNAHSPAGRKSTVT
jgi:Transposase DDE domain